MKFCSRTKCWRVTLRFNCQNKFPFFQEIFSYFQIFICLIQSNQIVLILILMLSFVTLFFNFGFGNNIFLIFTWLFCKHFFYPITFATIYFVFSDPAKNVFSIFLIPPSREIMFRPFLWLAVHLLPNPTPNVNDLLCKPMGCVRFISIEPHICWHNVYVLVFT